MAAQETFAYAALVVQIVLLVLFATCTEYTPMGKASAQTAQEQLELAAYYPMFQDVHVMIFVGFGMLMTFLHKYGFSSVGLNFFIAAVALQVALFWNAFWHNAVHGDWSHKITLDVKALITGDFGAGAVLISFGALLGKVTPLQLLVVCVVELCWYALNEVLGATVLLAVDMGGSMYVHTFGAYFGLACSRMLCPAPKAIDNADNKSSKTSDQFAMIGTIFLWMFWPSFNGALAFNTNAPGSQQRVVVNTVLALAACCISAFAASALLRGDRKFDTVDIQNATLAGGVAVGSSADLVIEPWGAVVVGMVAGIVSVAGYVHVSPWLEEKLGVTDTCGVHNLHGMPGLIGGIGGAISAASATSDMKGYDADAIAHIFPGRGAPPADVTDAESWTYKTYNRNAGKQGAFQFFALLTTLGMALCGGAFTGWLVGKVGGGDPGTMFDDKVYWEVPGEDHDEEGGGGGAAEVKLSSV